MSTLLDDLKAIVGSTGLISTPSELLVYECDGYVIEKNRPDVVVFPTSTEQVVRIVGEAGMPSSGGDDVMDVSVNSPMGDALMKARVGDTVKVKAPRGTNEFKILEIVG